MPIPIIDFDDLVLQELPASHRTPRFIEYYQGMMSQNKWLNQRFMNYCFGDPDSGVWNKTITYSYNDIVVTYFGTFISLIDSNTGNNPNLEPILQSDGSFEYTNWYKIAPSLVGAYERGCFTSQKLNMEFGLNKYFKTTYRNPTSIVSGGYLPLSDIYITTTEPTELSFISYTTEDPSSDSFTNNSQNKYSFTTVITAIDTTYEFVVHIPTSLAADLGVDYESIIRSKVDKVCLIGTSYSVITY